MLYANGRKFSNVNSLRDAIFYNWDMITLDVVHWQISSIRKRCCDVIKRDGDKIAYL